jgi:hypothetical protein
MWHRERALQQDTADAQEVRVPEVRVPKVRVPEVRVPEVHSPPERPPRQEGIRTRARATAWETPGRRKTRARRGKAPIARKGR